MKLQGEQVVLRALEPSDVDALHLWENDTETWNVSNTLAPFSRFVLEEYIESSQQDIYAAKQLRLMIVRKPLSIADEPKPIGCIDLFDFDPNHQRAGIGILIAEKGNRRSGYASEALRLLIEYCFSTLNLHQVYCNITTDNKSSISLFEKQGFEIVGVKKQWIREGDTFKDELLLQKIK